MAALMQHSKILVRSVINYCFLGTETVLRTTDHEMTPVVLGWRRSVWCGAGGLLATGTITNCYRQERQTVLPQAVWKRQAFRVACSDLMLLGQIEETRHLPKISCACAYISHSWQESSSGLWTVDCVWNMMAHAQRPDFVFRRNGRVHLNRRGRQFCPLLAAEVCPSMVVILDTPCSEVVWRVLATHSICQFPLHFPSCASSCAITFHLDSTTLIGTRQRNLWDSRVTRSTQNQNYTTCHGNSWLSKQWNVITEVWETTLSLPDNKIDTDNAVRLLAILAAVDKCSLGQNPHIPAILRQEAIYSGLTLSFWKHWNRQNNSRLIH